MYRAEEIMQSDSAFVMRGSRALSARSGCTIACTICVGLDGSGRGERRCPCWIPRGFVRSVLRLVMRGPGVGRSFSDGSPSPTQYGVRTWGQAGINMDNTTIV
jgi:hypothetical protein